MVPHPGKGCGNLGRKNIAATHFASSKGSGASGGVQFDAIRMLFLY